MGFILWVGKAITALFDEVDHIQLFEKIIQDEKAYEKIARLRNL